MQRFSRNTDLPSREQEADRFLDEVLKSNLHMDLPGDFPDLVMAKVSRRLMWRQIIQEFIVYASVIISGLAAGAATFFIFGNGLYQDWARIITQNITHVVQVIVVIMFILFFDRVVLPLLVRRYRKKTETLIW